MKTLDTWWKEQLAGWLKYHNPTGEEIDEVVDGISVFMSGLDDEDYEYWYNTGFRKLTEHVYDIK